MHFASSVPGQHVLERAAPSHDDKIKGTMQLPGPYPARAQLPLPGSSTHASGWLSRLPCNSLLELTTPGNGHNAPCGLLGPAAPVSCPLPARPQRLESESLAGTLYQVQSVFVCVASSVSECPLCLSLFLQMDSELCKCSLPNQTQQHLSPSKPVTLSPNFESKASLWTNVSERK
jgi:hypothetical protein